MKKLLNLFLLLFIFSLSFIFINCGGSGADTQNYQSENLSGYSIKTVSLLPIRNTYLNIGEAQNVNRYFAQGVNRKIKGITIIGPDESIEQLNKDTLVEEYFQYLTRYATTGIPNTAFIKKIGNSLNADAIVQGEIFNIVKIDGQYGHNKGKTTCSLRYSLISTNDGKVLWETTADAYETTDFTTDSAPPLMDVVQEGMNKIIESFPSLNIK